MVNHLIYDAFGKVTSESSPTLDSLFLFTARPFDADTGLQNNLNRWYDAHVGRWLSEDPIGFAGGDGNLYRYVKNETLTGVDPEGLRRWCRGTLTYRVLRPIKTIKVILPATGSSGLSRERIQKLVEDATREWAKNDGKLFSTLICPVGMIPGSGQRIRVAQQFEGDLRIFVKLSRRFFGLFGDWTAVIVTDPRKEDDQWSLGMVLFLAVYQKEFQGEFGPCCEKTSPRGEMVVFWAFRR